MSCLSQVELEDIQQAFRLLDTQGQGMIDTRELKGLMEQLKTDSNDAAVAIEPFLHVLNKHTEMLDIHAFSDLFTSSQKNPNDYDYIFKLFDSEQKGYITKENLQKVAENLGEQMTNEELQEMLDRASSDKNGKVTLQDFHNIMTKKLFS